MEILVIQLNIIITIIILRIIKIISAIPSIIKMSLKVRGLIAAITEQLYNNYKTIYLLKNNNNNINNNKIIIIINNNNNNNKAINYNQHTLNISGF